jgi:aryl-alcohol dehydrogenase
MAAGDVAAMLNLGQLRRGLILRACPFGDRVPAAFVPRLVKLYRRRLFPVDRLVTEYRLEEINRAAEDLLTGAAVKPVLVMP